MDNIIIEPLVQFLQQLPIEITSLILFIICVITMLILLKLFGQHGLQLYSIVAILAANIQVFKLVQFSFTAAPVALGTIVFATTYLCSGILAENYGKAIAEQNIWFGFSAQILFTIFMIITIGHRPMINNHALGDGYTTTLNLEQSLKLIFTPLPRLLLASLLSFVISQKVGIYTFSFIKRFTQKSYLWLNTTLLLIVATTCDTFLFNILAWGVLSPIPMHFNNIFNTYILVTLITQGIITLMSAPIIYFSCKLKPDNLLKLMNNSA